jgi:hypothetical protein
MLTPNNTRDTLLRAFADRSNTYRQRIRPADIIQQGMIERRVRKPMRLAELLKKLVRRDSKV